jgi:hypothetical protein
MKRPGRMANRIAVILEVETDDPLFDSETFNDSKHNETPEGTALLREATVRACVAPGGIKRVVAVTGPELMKALLRTHELAADIAGLGGMFSRPTPDYEPPDGR